MAFGRGSERERIQLDFITIIGLVILALATFFQIAGLVSNHWVDTVSDQYGTVGYSGLWQTCTNMGLTRDSCRGFRWTDNQVSHWFRTVQAMEVLGFMFGCISLLMLLLKSLVETCMENRRLKVISIALLATAFLFVMIAGIVVAALKDVQKAFVINSDAYLSWGFGVSITASLLYLASCIAVGHYMLVNELVETNIPFKVDKYR
ncbi:hypothetical protein ACF0H5_012262 [Mactra antiquata]